MKKPYNETWVANLAIQETSEKWYSKNLISKEQVETLKTNFPEQFYRPGIFVKIGLFLFSTIACAFFGGFITLLFTNPSGSTFSVIAFISCLCFIFLLEYLIDDRKLFHSGIDNALLYAVLYSLSIGFYLLFENLEFWQYCILLLFVLIIATYRYADILTAAGSFLALFSLISNLMLKFPMGKALLPFAAMALSVIIYFLIKKIKDSYFINCRSVIEVLSVITFYLGGNYYVVREGNAWISNLTPSAQIAFAPVFYSFTAFIPLTYIILGLKSKNRIFLITGLLALGCSAGTFRHYFGFFTIAQGLTIAGILMIVLAVFCIQYLRTPKYGISDESEDERKPGNLEAIIAAQYLGQTPHEKGLEFGEGNFGGAGSGESY